MAAKLQTIQNKVPSTINSHFTPSPPGVKSKSRRKPSDNRTVLPSKPDVHVTKVVASQPRTNPASTTRITPTKVRTGSANSTGNSRISSAGSRKSPSNVTKVTRQVSAKPLGAEKGLPNGEVDNESLEDSEDGGIAFINIQSESERLSKDTLGKCRPIVPEELLAKSQEGSYDKVYEIDLHAAFVAQIHNLEKFRRVRILDLSCNYMQKIENLQSLQDVRELKLYDNRISIIEGLDNQRELCHLQLQHNKIKTIGKGFTALKRLKVLRLDSNLLLKMEPRELAGCSQLTSIDISGNKLDNISAVNCLPCLEELYAANNRLRTLTDLSRCKKLQEVDISGNKLQDLGGLKGLSNLTIVRASNNVLSSVKSLGKIKCLEEIYLSSNRITDLSHMTALFPALQILDVGHNHIETWQQVCSLSVLQELVEVFVAGNPFCAEEGPMPHYHTEILQVLPQLEVLDGALLKRPSSRAGTPLMRPMSASSVVSARQVETQLKFFQDEMSSFESSLAAKFESLRAGVESLAAESPSRPVSASAESNRSASANSNRPTSRCGKRSRIKEALEFAAHQQ